MSESKSLLLRSLQKEILEIPPIWYMRQAGRYMPEYRKIRSKFNNFLDMCKNPEICCELALQPINSFNLDSAILFSDILTIPEALGLKLEFIEGTGPVFHNKIRSEKDINQLIEFDPQALSFAYEAIRMTKRELPSHIPIIGFCGSPWTMAAYCIEGKSSTDFQHTKEFLKKNKSGLHSLLKKFEESCISYLQLQIEAGADVIQIFDSWANLLSKNDYEEFSLNYIKNIIQKIKSESKYSHASIIIFARQPCVNEAALIDTNTDCIGLYTTMKDFDIKTAEGKVALQGNLDPKILLEDNDLIKKETDKILDKFKNYPGYIFNLGHGITPNIKPDKIKFLTDYIRGC